MSMNYNMAGGSSNMLKKGHSMHTGMDAAVLKNIEAAKVHRPIYYGIHILDPRCVEANEVVSRGHAGICRGLLPPLVLIGTAICLP